MIYKSVFPSWGLSDCRLDVKIVQIEDCGQHIHHCVVAAFLLN